MPIRRGRFAPQNTFLETIAQKFDRGNSNFVLGGAQEKNNYPIVYCSDGFCELTGFSRSELMRRSCGCNFLYGLETNQDDITSIQKAFKAQVELKKEIMFYKKNGSPFWCLLDIVPIKNEKGNVVLFLASHKDITKRKISGEIPEQDVASVSGGTEKLSRSRSRKFSRDVLLHLSRQYAQSTGPANKANPRRPIKRARSFSFNSERLPQYKRETDKKSKFLFLHYSNTKGFWDWWILILTTYIAIMVPYNVAYRRNDRKRDLIIFDMVIELFFIMDIVVHFRTSFVDPSGRIIYDQKKIAIHYLKGWFVLDFLAALPFEALYFVNQTWAHSTFDRKGSSFNEGFLIQLLKCGRLLRLFRVVRKLHRYTEYSAILLTLLMIAFAMMAHWLACIWYVIGLSEVLENSTVSWLYALGETINKPYVNFTAETGPDEGSAYITALYFTLTSMTTVGFGNVAANTNGEKVFAVVTMLIGALMHAAIFGNVAAIIQKLYANRVRYHSRANEIKQFIRVHRIDQDLANRLEDYFHTTWSLSGGVDTSEILTTFPEELQSDVCMHLYKGLLELSPFNLAPRGCLKMLSPQVRTVYIGPGEVLLAQNDVINSIYYIANGSMEVLQGESVAAILGKGDLFGEDISRRTPAKRANGDVRALTYCDVYFITRDRLQNVLHFYQDFAFKFSENLELTYDLGASERDIWRRGGLDSISEDEEEDDEETETNALDGVFNHVNHTNHSKHSYSNATRFNRRPGNTLNLYRKPNHLKLSESWTGLMKNNSSELRNRSNHVDKRPLCVSSPEDETSRPQSPRSLVRQLAVEVNAGSINNNALDFSPEEKSSSEPFTDRSLEWDQENFSLKNEANSPNGEKDGGQCLEMKKVETKSSASLMGEIDEEEENDERDKLLLRHSFSEDESIDANSQTSDSPVLSKRFSQDFSTHLSLGCEGIDASSLFANGDKKAAEKDEDTSNYYPKRITEEDDNDCYPRRITMAEDNPCRLNDSIGDIRKSLYDDVFDSSSDLHNTDTPIGLFDNGIGDTVGGSYDDVDGNCFSDLDTSSSITRLPRYISSPTFSNRHRNSGQSTVTSPVESVRGSCRSGLSELPFRGSFTDGPNSPYGEPRGFSFSPYCEGARASRENSAESSRNSIQSRGFETQNSPRNKLMSVVSGFRAPSPYGGSLKDGQTASRPKRGRNGGLRRTLTEFYSPTNSNSSLNEKPAPPGRRRKVSGAIKPPAIFAPLVTNVSSPYKDFVPPVRESAITCDCEAPHAHDTTCENRQLSPDSEKDGCEERKSDHFDTDNSEDRGKDFFGDAGNLIAEKQLRRLSGRDNDRLLRENLPMSRSTLSSQASMTKRELESDPSQKIDDSSIECNSVKEIDDDFERRFSISSYSNTNHRPSLSGAYSTECIEKEEIPESDEQGQLFRPMRSSFSEPHLSLRTPVLEGIAEHRFSEEELQIDQNCMETQDTHTRNLEEIFKDVCSTKEAIEKLELILSSSETDTQTDLADTKQTVKKLDKQVLNLNKEVESLSSDVKMILKLLKSMKNGEVVA